MKIQQTYIHLHNQEAQNSCNLGSYVNDEIIIKNLYIVANSSENLKISILLSGPFVPSTVMNVFTGIMPLVIKALTDISEEAINYSYSTKAEAGNWACDCAVRSTILAHI